MHSSAAIIHKDSYMTDFMRQLKQLRDQGFLCDVRVIAGDMEYPAHKMVLAASSSYFKSLFEPKENGASSEEITSICLKNCQPDVLTVVLNYLYSGHLELGVCKAQDVLGVAKTCKISSLESLMTTSVGNKTAKVKNSPKFDLPELQNMNKLDVKTSPRLGFGQSLSLDTSTPDSRNEKENEDEDDRPSSIRSNSRVCPAHNCDLTVCRCPAPSLHKTDRAPERASPAAPVVADQSSSATLMQQLYYNLCHSSPWAMAAFNFMAVNQQRMAAMAAAAAAAAADSRSSPLFAAPNDLASPHQNIPQAFNQHLLQSARSMMMFQQQQHQKLNMNINHSQRNNQIREDDEKHFLDETADNEIKSQKDFNSSRPTSADYLSPNIRSSEDADELSSLVIAADDHPNDRGLETDADDSDMPPALFVDHFVVSSSPSPKTTNSGKKRAPSATNLAPLDAAPILLAGAGGASGTMDNSGEKMFNHTDDRDGWCRNKKYIRKTANGHFQCVLCEKTYGRYNSVSYHVTIYHRNPPIVCDHAGCNFQTREARYIHFHKFYRHDVPLPSNIDLDARRCPYCRHVAKSPAMLDKHMKRHEANSNNNASPANGVGKAKSTKLHRCILCEKDFASKASLAQHSVVCRRKMAQEISKAGTVQMDLINNDQNTEKVYLCDKCPYRTTTVASLEQHKLFKHQADLWSNKHTCDQCDYSTPSAAILSAHKTQKHNSMLQYEDDVSNNNDLPLNLRLLSLPEPLASTGGSSSLSPDTTTKSLSALKNSTIDEDNVFDDDLMEIEDEKKNKLSSNDILEMRENSDMKKFAHFLVGEGISSL